ncbi:MAG: hypothetical protein O3C40_33580 [Planctomycetota bacterium]|nr:hypothetical protein [Planctomycetota bacterium]
MTLRYDLGGVGFGPNGRLAVNLHTDCDIHHDFTDLDGFIERDGCVEEFYLCHSLEHVPVTRYRKFLGDMSRKLRPGGRVVVVQTDAGTVIRQWIGGELSFRAMRATLFTPAERIHGNPLNQHHNMWTADELARDFESLGLQATMFDAGWWSFDMIDAFLPNELTAYHGVPIHNLGVVASKPMS